MTVGKSLHIDIKQVLEQKAPAVAKKIPSFLLNYLIRKVHQDELNEILDRYRDLDGVAFMKAVVGYFDLNLEVKGQEHLPADGRFIFVSNHPLGGLDGICLSALIGERYGGEVRYLVNDLLMYIPNLQSIFVPINKHGRQSKENASLIEAAYASDHPVITFPAGLCSRRIHGKIQDLPWMKSFIQKAVDYQRDVVPIFFDGVNSSAFYRMAQLRKLLGIKMNYEMFLLPDEMFKAKHKTFRIYIGAPVSWQHFDHSRKPAEWAEMVRKRVYELNIN